MKALIAILIIVAVVFAARELASFYQKSSKGETGNQSQTPATPAEVRPEDLPGLPVAYEASLQTAYQGGADGLRTWLKRYRTIVKDPRLARIELDYVSLINLDNPKEARRVFQSVKARVNSSSPVYDLVKKLEKTFD